MTAIPLVFHNGSLLRAWIQAARHVASSAEASFVLVVSSDADWTPNASAFATFSSLADRHGWERPVTVSDMIIPRIVLEATTPTADALDLGLRMFGRGRAQGMQYSGWTHTYFERIVGAWIDRFGARRTFNPNRLLEVVDKLNHWGRNAESACYVHTELPTDGFRTRGGPCLQYVQFRAYGDRQLSVSALYRAHDYGNKALGNVIGLDRLGRFVARRTGRTFSGVSVISLHPFSQHKGRLRQFADDIAAASGF